MGRGLTQKEIKKIISDEEGKMSKEKTRANIQIKGNKKAVEKMLRLVEKIEDQGVEVRLTIERSKPSELDKEE